MAMLFSEQQPKQVHKAHLEQSMCQAMNTWNTPAWEPCPSPEPSQDHGNPCRIFTRAWCAPQDSRTQLPCPGDVPWIWGHAWHTPGTRLAQPLLLTCPQPGSTEG